MPKLLLDPKFVVSEYLSGKSAAKIARENGCSVWSVIERLRNEKIVQRPNNVPHSLNLSENDKTKFLSLVDGLMLGDGSIHKKGYIQVHQHVKRLGWLEQIQQEFATINCVSKIHKLKPKKNPAFIDGRQIMTGEHYGLYTQAVIELREQRKRWYPNGKIVPKDVFINDLSTAMWFSGDGTHNGYSLTFCTQGFTKECVDMLHTKLNDKFCIKSTFREHRENQYVVSISNKKDSLKLRNAVIKNIPECCLYKFDGLKEF